MVKLAFVRRLMVVGGCHKAKKRTKSRESEGTERKDRADVAGHVLDVIGFVHGIETRLVGRTRTKFGCGRNMIAKDCKCKPTYSLIYSTRGKVCHHQP